VGEIIPAVDTTGVCLHKAREAAVLLLWIAEEERDVGEKPKMKIEKFNLHQ
jgi:hypothetical protein